MQAATRSSGAKQIPKHTTRAIIPKAAISFPTLSMLFSYLVSHSSTAFIAAPTIDAQRPDSDFFLA